MLPFFTLTKQRDGNVINFASIIKSDMITKRSTICIKNKSFGEKTWCNRAIFIYFKMHRQLDSNSLNLTSKVFLG